jgi:SAM-dependent methyltransferase
MKIPYARSFFGSRRPSRLMRKDWDLRARENALFYIDCGHGESETEFWASGRKDLDLLILRGISLAPDAVAVEIGCGIGRILRPLAGRAARAYGVDISREMVRRARRALRDVPNVRVFRTKGALDKIPTASCDFVYSFIVFQHIPVKSAVSLYIGEAVRVLKGRGIFRFQADGRASGEAAGTDTWNGVRYAAGELRGELEAAGFEVLDATGEDTQYMWFTACRRSEAGRPESAAAQFSGAVWDVPALERLGGRLGHDPAETAVRILRGESGVRLLAEGFIAAHRDAAPADYVRRAYRAILDRDPDPDGLAFYTREIESGIARENVVDCLIASPEFDAKHRTKRPAEASATTRSFLTTESSGPEEA